MDHRLTPPPYLAFPLRIGAAGGVTADRRRHVRDLIEQVLFTDPGERVFRPDFGVGLRALVFEPNTVTLWNVTRRRILSALTEVLQGEVDPSSLTVEVTGDIEQLAITVSYVLATIGVREEQRFELPMGAAADV